jgi:hypothetical protein
LQAALDAAIAMMEGEAGSQDDLEDEDADEEED